MTFQQDMLAEETRNSVKITSVVSSSPNTARYNVNPVFQEKRRPLLQTPLVAKTEDPISPRESSLEVRLCCFICRECYRSVNISGQYFTLMTDLIMTVTRVRFKRKMGPILRRFLHPCLYFFQVGYLEHLEVFMQSWRQIRREDTKMLHTVPLPGRFVPRITDISWWNC